MLCLESAWVCARHLRYVKMSANKATTICMAPKCVFPVIWANRASKLSSLIDQLTSQRAANVSLMFLTGW